MSADKPEMKNRSYENLFYPRRFASIRVEGF